MNEQKVTEMAALISRRESLKDRIVELSTILDSKYTNVKLVCSNMDGYQTTLISRDYMTPRVRDDIAMIVVGSIDETLREVESRILKLKDEIC